MVQIETKLTKEMYQKFNKYHFFSTNKKFRIVINILSIFLIIYPFLNLHTFNDLNLYLIILGIIALIEFNTPIVPNLFVNRILKTDKTILSTTCTYTFNDEYYEVKTDSGYNKIYYKNLYKWVEIDNFYYLYLNSKQANIIDKSNLTKSDNKKLNDIIIKNKIKIIKK